MKSFQSCFVKYEYYDGSYKIVSLGEKFICHQYCSLVLLL
jgi:hypothetical protein